MRLFFSAAPPAVFLACLATGLSACSGTVSSAKTSPTITYVTQGDTGETKVETCRLEMSGIKSRVSRVDCETQR